MNRLEKIRDFQCETLAHLYVGEMVTSVQRATLIPGGFESLVYTTLSGSIGVLLPFASNEVNIMCEMMMKIISRLQFR